MKNHIKYLLVILSGVPPSLVINSAIAATYTVGPGDYATVHDVIASGLLVDGDTIVIAAGYTSAEASTTVVTVPSGVTITSADTSNPSTINLGVGKYILNNTVNTNINNVILTGAVLGSYSNPLFENRYSMVLDTVTVTGNTLNTVVQTDAGAGLTINNSTFSNNTNNGLNYNGLIYNNGGNVSITGGTFDSNTFVVSKAAIQNMSGAMTIDGTTFNANSSTTGYGAGIYNAAALVITDANFTNNIAGNAGAIYNGAGSSLSIVGGTFESNTASVFGGAVMASAASVFTVDGATFTTNHANATMGYGGAVIVANFVGGQISNSDFNGNTAFNGGAIASYSTGGYENSLFITDSTFENNIAYGNGGAVYTTANATTTINGSSFTSNTANATSGFGGAIYTELGGTVSLTNTDFTTNSAFDGGAIYNLGSMTISGGTFLQNQSFQSLASTGGGAIFNAGTLNISGAEFTQNSTAGGGYGGAILNTGNLTVTGGSFAQNTANSGGAINSLGSAGALNVTGVLFDNNTASSSGGAIAAEQGTVTIDQSTFTNNTAATGGAISDIGTLSAPATINITNSIFDNNTATTSRGGAIYVSNNGSVLNVSGSSFTNNKSLNASNGYGGAIFNILGATTINNSYFEGNSANNGGALGNMSTASTMSIGAGTSFVSNTATINGGAIYNSGQMNLTGVSFETNSSGSRGGAIYNNSTMTIDTFTFNGNYSVSYGGAIFGDSSSSLTLSNGSFIGNYTTSTSGNGGALYLSASSNSLGINNVLFQNNSTAIYGGAIFDESLGTTNITSSTFDQNSSGTMGGALFSYNVNKTVNISDSLFTNNYTTGASGMGGAIINYNTVKLNIDTTGFDNNSAFQGGAIYNMGTATLNIAGGTSFTNNTADSGGAIYNHLNGVINLDSTNDNIVFSGNTAITNGADIYMDGATSVMNIIGTANTVSLDGGIAGLGTINKSNNGTLYLAAGSINSGYTGLFRQTAGNTIVATNDFFMGTNNISGGTVFFLESATANSMVVTDGANIDIRSQAIVPAYAMIMPAAATIPQFNTLTVNWWGADNANLYINTSFDITGTNTDKLVVDGMGATGDTTIFVTSVGATDPSAQDIMVVDLTNATDKSATFALNGGMVDTGAHEYYLIQEADENWYLHTDYVITSAAQTAGAIPVIHLAVVKAGMNELRKRLGELRGDDKSRHNGVWARAYGKNLDIHKYIDADMNLLGFEGGIDRQINVDSGRMYVGVMAGMLESSDIRIHQSNGQRGTGTTRAPSVGVYGTWIHKSGSSNKWFIDATARYFWVDTDLKNIAANGQSVEYDIDRNFIATSLETGKLFYFHAPEFANIGTKQRSHMSMEPKMELRFKHAPSTNATTNFADDIHIDSTTAFNTKLALQTNYLPNGTQSVWKPWVEIGVFREWLGNENVGFGGAQIHTSARGTGMELAAGTNVSLGERSYGYAGFTYETGAVYTSYMINIGARHKF
ncbi:MAG: autotransporter outer membrane beta-barrel domain-containing protein [Alphaproteobacteria bacterium]|nr:autotransporter outer membrane beta-barrel domain-containing protein [Alphaproteobacteria bacterium]